MGNVKMLMISQNRGVVVEKNSIFIKCNSTTTITTTGTIMLATIYKGKPEISVEKPNGSRHSVWKYSENMGCDFRRFNLFWSVQKIWIYFMAFHTSTWSNFTALCSCSSFFQPVGLCKW